MISIENVTVAYGGYVLLDNINFHISDSDKIGLVGKNGAGKSTILKMICGLQNPTSGRIDRPKDITIGYLPQIMEHHKGRSVLDEALTVFQSSAEIEHRIESLTKELETRTDYESESYSELIEELGSLNDRLEMSHSEPPEVQARRTLLGLGFKEEELGRNTETFSQGWNMRIELAKILLRKPRVLLLDEPLSNLDARLRLQTREEIRRIQRETHITTVFVTHDQEEAMSISDMIVVMKSGVVQQIGAPQEVYDDPKNLFVAKFLGTPPINVFNGKVESEKLYIGGEAVLDVKGAPDGEVMVGVRPEGFIIDDYGPFHCKLSSVEVMGRDVSIVSTNEASVNPIIRSIINADNKVDPATETVSYALKPHKVFIFNKETEERIYFEV